MRSVRARRAELAHHDSAARLSLAGVDVFFGDAVVPRCADADGWRRCTAFPPRGHCYWRPSVRSGDPGSRGCLLPDIRKRVLTYCPADQASRDRRRSGRLRAGAGLCAARHDRYARRSRPAGAASRRRRSVGDPSAEPRRRRRAHHDGDNVAGNRGAADVWWCDGSVQRRRDRCGCRARCDRPNHRIWRD